MRQVKVDVILHPDGACIGRDRGFATDSISAWWRDVLAEPSPVHEDQPSRGITLVGDEDSVRELFARLEGAPQAEAVPETVRRCLDRAIELLEDGGPLAEATLVALVRAAYRAKGRAALPERQVA